MPDASSAAREPDAPQERFLPQSPDAEKGLLGSFLLSPEEVGNKCAEAGFTRGHFHVPAHAEIFDVLTELWRANLPCDFITLTQILRDRNRLDHVGGASFVTNLFTFLPTAANCDYYMEIIADKHTLRRVIATCGEAMERAYGEQEDVPRLLDDLERKALAIRPVNGNSDVDYSNSETLLDVIENIEWMQKHPGEISGLSTGFYDIDLKTNGLHPQQMIVIAARPSMGKTALATNIAEHVAITLNKPVALFSLEMSKQQLIQRLLCSRARINLERIIAGKIEDRDYPSLTRASAVIANAPLYISDDADRSIEAIKARARRLKKDKGIVLLVIDYLQLIQSRSARGRENRNTELSYISTEIKSLAKELNIPVIIIAAVNRDPEKRGGRPRMSDLRECGQIEYDGDVIMLLHRDEMYAESTEEKDNLEGQATLNIAKQKQGSTGDVELTFLKEYTRFEDRARDYQP